jgi:uncharacterized protein (TIRG00374 family)
VGPGAVSAALATSLLAYLIRFARWQLFLEALDVPVPWKYSLHVYLAGLALTGTPGKAGELVRGVFLSRFGLSYARSFLIFFWDRLCDLAGITLLALASAALVSSHHLLLVPVVLLWVLAFWFFRPGGRAFTTVVLATARRVSRKRRRRITDLARLRAADTRMTKRLAALGVMAGACAYGLHGVGLGILARAAGCDISLAGALLVVAMSSLAGAAVMLPAGAGLVETTSVGILMALGLDKADAVALGLLHRATTFWFATAIGAFGLSSLALRSHHAR